MAATSSSAVKFTSTILISFFLSAAFIPAGKSQEHFARRLSRQEMGLKKQKLSHLRFYFHDKVSGPKPTAIRLVKAAVSNSSIISFGTVVIIDDRLTIGPEISSRTVGRAQGIYASADLTNVGLLMVMNYAFTEGKFNGSTLSILGRNAIFSRVREMPVVGGSGVFRFARGYAQAMTRSFDPKSGDAVVEYNVYVFHY